MRWQTLMLALAVAIAASSIGPHAQTPAPAIGPQPAVPGWDEFVENLRTLPDHMLTKLPADERNDPQVRQEIGRLALEALASSTLDAIEGDGDHPVFVAQVNQTLNVGQPNADTIYRMADITPGGTYRLRGRRGTLRIVKIGEVTPQVGAIRLYHDVNALHVDSEGRYDVILSPARPAGYTGDWWPLSPTTAKLLLRTVSSDWEREQDPTFSIERLDHPVMRPRPPAADLEQRLRRLPGTTAFIAQMFVDHVESLRRQGYVNKLKVFDVSQMGGLVGQSYYEGAYDLHDDEALIVETRAPAKCLYRSLILTNEIYETTDWTNNESSLNDSQAPVDRDGILRIVVSARDPGVQNWLDTAGYPQGVIQGRWTNCDSQPVPTVRKVAFADLRKELPSDTPTVSPVDREKIIRERRAAFQQRPQW
jgi:hypothetical protein